MQDRDIHRSQRTVCPPVARRARARRNPAGCGRPSTPCKRGRCAGAALPARLRGQALTESLVVMAVLVPFVIAIPLIARYQDIRHATISAARTAAFECTVRFETCAQAAVQDELAAQLRRRHFSRHHIDLHSADGADDETLPQERRRFWVDRTGKPLLASFKDVSLEIDQGRADFVKRLSPLGIGVGHLAEKFSKLAGPDAFGMPLTDGLMTARVQVRVPLDESFRRKMPAGFPESLNFRERSVVLVDAWNASSAKGGEARSLSSRVARGRRLPGVSDILQTLDGAVPMLPPAFSPQAMPKDDPDALLDLFYKPLEFIMTHDPLNEGGEAFRRGEVDVEIVPGDRLKRN